jgi:5-methylcytosine-specific restriction protein A
MPGGGNPFPVTDSQWQAIQSHRAQRTAGPNTDLTRTDAGDTSGKQPSNSQLRWTREEDILALDLFVDGGVVNGGSFLGKDDPRVIALSQQLRSMPTHPGVPRDDKFRNPSGVELKLMNFRAVEKAVKQELEVPGANELPSGMARYSAMDKAIFEEYYNNDFLDLASDAHAICSAAADAPEPLATVTAEDRPVEDASTATYEAAGAEGGTRSRAEHALVRRYADWLEAAGIKVVSRLYRVPGLARPFCVTRSCLSETL